LSAASTGAWWPGCARAWLTTPGIDANVVRLAFVIASFLGFIGVLAYLAAWVILPEEGESVSIAENIINKKRSG
jgi:hypothetical protein